MQKRRRLLFCGGDGVIWPPLSDGLFCVCVLTRIAEDREGTRRRSKKEKKLKKIKGYFSLFLTS